MYLPHVKECLSNPSITIREIAAKILATWSLEDDRGVGLVKDFITLANRGVKDNYRHGLLLKVSILPSEKRDTKSLHYYY